MDRGQKLDEKNGAVCLFMFTPRTMIIKIPKKIHFLYFLLMRAKNQSQLGQNI